MSVIAWDGKTLAADCQGTNQGLRRRVSKIERLEDGTVLGWVGSEDTGGAQLRWYKAGADINAWPASQTKEDWSVLVVVRPDRTVTMYEQYNVPLPVLEPFWAWGSGRDFAIGALAMGADAREAVEVAIQFNIDCGFGVEAYDMIPLALVNSGD
jgi:hypothetical protein